MSTHSENHLYSQDSNKIHTNINTVVYSLSTVEVEHLRTDGGLVLLPSKRNSFIRKDRVGALGCSEPQQQKQELVRP